LDNAFLPRVYAIKGEGEALKCGDGEKASFSLCERGKVEGVGPKKKKA